jgi:UDP-2,3-diacylglucosamine pyrophosphatase LpxH
VSPHARQQNYILFSDVHLGADLVQHVRPFTIERLKQMARIDRELAAMLDHYREHAEPGRPWKLVIAGDLVDFIGMSIAPSFEHMSDLTPEEREHGLGSTEAHAAAKMRAVATRHSLVFQKLAAFLADGHSLVLVRGNHDVDFHWATARRAFVDAIVERIEDATASREVIEGRVEFHPWFYYEEGLLYVEHGHQFDTMCSYHNLLCPVSPRDPRRISWSFSDILLRLVVRPTPGIGSDGHDEKSMFDYAKLGWSFGLRGAARLGYRYLAATVAALRRWRAHLGGAAQALREEHERRMAELAGTTRLGLDRLKALAALWPAPITHGALAVLRSMFLDRVLLALLVLLVAVPLVVLAPTAWALPIAGALLAGFVVWIIVSGRLRLRDVDPAEAMRRAARRIAKLVHTRYVVMGHTHVPVFAKFDDDATYVNLGHWGVDDLDGPTPDAPRTHLVLRWRGDDVVAELLAWIPGQGPRPSDQPG